MIDSGVSSSTLHYFQNSVKQVDFTRDNSNEDFIDHGTATLSVHPSIYSNVDFGEYTSRMPRDSSCVVIDHAQSSGSR